MRWLQLIRYPNLIIVAITQFLFFWFIQNVFAEDHIIPVLGLPNFSLLVLTTLCIAASGYVINDIVDYEIDLVNKPDRMILGESFSIKKAYRFYALIIFIGGLMAFYLAHYVEQLGLFFIYPFAVFLLWWYSKSLKAAPLSGNVVIAFFSAFVPGIVWFAERKGFAALSSTSGVQMRNLFLFYMVFAFFSTVYREIIKDIEDYQGDIDNHCRTIPIVFGIKKARFISHVFANFLLISILYWIISQWNQLGSIFFFLSFILLLLPYFVSLRSLIKAKTKEDYHRTSQLIKLMMILGLLYLFLFQILN